MTHPDRTHIYAAIDRERAHQDRKYGTPADRNLSIKAYANIATREIAEAIEAFYCDNHPHALAELLQAAAVIVACIEQHGLIERTDLPDDNK